MEHTPFHALDYLTVFRRRKWWLLVPLAASVVVGAALVRFLPKEYRSSATLGVAAATVSPNFVNQSAGFDNQERLRALSQQMLSAPILARVVQEEQLPGGPSEAQLARLRRSIELTVPDPLASTPEPRRLDTFVVSYADSEPTRAQRIANRLVNVFVDENQKTRAEAAEDTSMFIATQLRASHARLADLEAQVRQAKEAHIGQLPEQTQANLQTLSGLRQQMETNATALRGEEDRLTMIERQINAMKQGDTDAVGTGRDAGLPDTQSVQSRLAAAERDLAAARAVYTDKHPEVVRLQGEVETARSDAAAQRRLPVSDRAATLATNPAYRQLLTDDEVSRIRIRELQRAEQDGRKQIAMYQARVEAAPMVEQQLASVQRDYDLERQQYADLSAKLHASTISESLERNRRSEQFTVLYPASFPLAPTKPIPWRVMLLSILAGLTLGAGLIFVREYFDRSVHDARELKDGFELPVLAEVSRISA